MRIAVIGDVGGHAESLRHELARLGARPDGSLPEDLLVVQVGDLIHRGPDSAEVVNIVDRYLRTQPDQWIQLIGNHEANYLQPPVFRWPESLSRRHIRILNRWWQSGAATIAAAVETAGESFLITHAGITAEFWATSLGGPLTAAEAARRINELAKIRRRNSVPRRHSPARDNRPGCRAALGGHHQRTAPRLDRQPHAVQPDPRTQRHHLMARKRHRRFPAAALMPSSPSISPPNTKPFNSTAAGSSASIRTTAIHRLAHGRHSNSRHHNGPLRCRPVLPACASSNQNGVKAHGEPTNYRWRRANDYREHRSTSTARLSSRPRAACLKPTPAVNSSRH